MKKTLFFVLFVAGLWVCSTNSAFSLTIEGDEFPEYTQIDTEFASYGVVFNSNMGYVTFGMDGGRLGIFGTDSSGDADYSFLKFNAPIEMTFVDPNDFTKPSYVNALSAVWGDGGGDVDFLRLRLFDLNDNLIETVLSEGQSWQTIEYSGSGIHKAIFDQQIGAPYPSDTFLDSLTFDLPTSSVPEPATILLFGIGIAGIVISRFRGRIKGIH